MLNSLEIIEIIKEYLEDVNGDLKSVKMFGVNNQFAIRYTAQKEILENLLDYIDFRIAENEHLKNDADSYMHMEENK